jgi:Glycosyl transferase family 2
VSERVGDGAPSSSPPPGTRVSIGIFCYNQAQFVADCIAGAAAQEYPDLEFFLVDDGSTDGSADALRTAGEQLARWPCTVLSDGVNRGLAARMNEVLERVTGEWIIWVASDDALLPGAVARLLGGATSGVDVVWGDLEVVDQAGRPKGYRRPADTWQGDTARRYAVPANPMLDIFRVNNFIPGGMTLIRAEALRAVGGYLEDVATEDMTMWLRLSPRSLFRYIGEPVGRYRVVEGSHSRSESGTVRDQALLASRLSGSPGIPRDGLARLVAMRWALSVGRSHGRPPLPLSEVAEISGIPRPELVRAMPRAVLDPIWMSGAALLRTWRRDRQARSASAPA